MKPSKHQYNVEIGATKLRIENDEYGITIDGGSPRHPRVEPAAGLLRDFMAIADTNPVRVYVEQGDGDHEYIVYMLGEAIRVRVATPHDERVQALRKNTALAHSTGHIVTAPMPGLLKQVLVSQGDIVEKGGPLCILEAMKMENEIKSPARLIVKRVIAVPGRAVEKSAPLIELQAIQRTD